MLAVHSVEEFALWVRGLGAISLETRLAVFLEQLAGSPDIRVMPLPLAWLGYAGHEPCMTRPTQAAPRI